MKNFTNDTYELIESYLKNDLEIDTKRDFERLMARDEALREEVVKIKLLKEIIKRHLTRTTIQHIHETKMNEWFLKKNIGDEENTEVEEEAYEEEVPAQKRNGLLSILLKTITVLLLVSAIIFVVLAKLPVEIQETEKMKAWQHEAELNSVQKINYEDYLEAHDALKMNNDEKASLFFDKVKDAQNTSDYFKDAAEWFGTVARSSRKPFSAEARFQKIINDSLFRYRYSQKDKIQVWCKIQWAKLMGWHE